MEKMPYSELVDAAATPASSLRDSNSSPVTDWRSGLPTLTGCQVVLRELRLSDAAALYAAVSSQEVTRFLSPPPNSVAGFERFIQWTHRQRALGQYACFAIVPRGSDTAVGLFQLRSLEPAFGNAEWGFALASEYWGTGMFSDGAQLVINFAFNTIGSHRLEARAAVKNGRGNGALRKLGARQEGVLRRSFVRRGEYLDQALWTILVDEWREQETVEYSHSIH
jgi:ribosomal-protein-alanine N-acetyltransferase